MNLQRKTHTKLIAITAPILVIGFGLGFGPGPAAGQNYNNTQSYEQNNYGYNGSNGKNNRQNGNSTNNPPDNNASNGYNNYQGNNAQSNATNYQGANGYSGSNNNYQGANGYNTLNSNYQGPNGTNSYNGNAISNKSAPGNTAGGNNYSIPVSNSTNILNAESVGTEATVNFGAESTIAPVNSLEATPPIESTASIPTGPIDLRYQFTQNGLPARHVFQVTWPTQDGTIQSINVVNSDNEEIIQQLALPADLDLTLVNVRDTREKFLDSLDYNFDGYADLRITKKIPYSAGTKQYAVYLYDPITSRYVFNQGISALGGVIVDEGKKRLISTDFTGRGGTEFTRNYFKIIDGVNIWIEERHTQSVIDPKNLTLRLDVRQRVGGELQRVCVIDIPTEGKRKIHWGIRRRCAPYLKSPIDLIR